MRTPQELAILIHREMGQGSLHINTWDNQLAVLLTAWRDECVEEASKPEAPAIDVDALTEQILDLLIGVDDLYVCRNDVRALLSRAPRAESEYETDVRNNLADLKARTEAAEAERDQLEELNRVYADKLGENSKVMDKASDMIDRSLETINALEVECDRLREENEALRSLVDGAEDVVELWGHATIHNGQREWAKGWLEKAREPISAKGGES